MLCVSDRICEILSCARAGHQQSYAQYRACGRLAPASSCVAACRNIDSTSQAVNNFKTATHKGTLADLNFFVTMLQNNVLGCVRWL